MAELRFAPLGHRGSGTASGLELAERKWGLILAVPAAAYFCVFWVFPLLVAIYYSFTTYDLVNDPQWVGLSNYSRLTQSPEFLHSVVVTLLFTVATVAPTIVVALLVALPLSRPGVVSFWLRGLLFIPTVMPLVASAVLWQVIYSTGGLANVLLSTVRVDSQPWLTSANLALWSLVVMVIWKSLGLFVLIFMAGAQTIPGNVYEAAAIDGSKTLRTFFQITLPLLRRTLLFVVVIAIIGAMQSFVPAYILTGGGPATATEVLPMYLYTNAFSFSKMGYASAIAVLMFIALGGLSWLEFRVFRTREDS